MKDSRNSAMNISSARKYTCPLTNTIMEEPVSVPCCSTNFERTALLSWMRKNGNRCPQTGTPLMPSHLKPNTKLQWEILYLERRNGHQMDGSERSSGSASPISSKGDCAPIHPRSPREGCVRKSLRCDFGTFPATKSHVVDSTEPVHFSAPPRTATYNPLLKNVDSPPTLPRRFNASLMPLPTIVLSLSGDVSMDDMGLPTRRSSLSSTF